MSRAVCGVCLCPYDDDGSCGCPPTNPVDQRLIDLLCRIHRDGGHYIAEHGLDKAIADADNKIAQLHASRDSAKYTLTDWNSGGNNTAA